MYKRQLTPSLAKKDGGGYAAEVGNITINNQSDTPLNIEALEFNAGSGITTSEFNVSENNEMILSGNTTLIVSTGATINNNGDIQLGSGSTMIVAGGTINNSTNANITVQPGASIEGDIQGDGQIIYQQFSSSDTTYRPDVYKRQARSRAKME